MTRHDRWYQFSLGTALALMVPFAIWCAMLREYLWFGWKGLLVGYPLGVAGGVLFCRSAIASNRNSLSLRAIVACLMISVSLCLFWICWPLRSLSKDLVPIHVLFGYKVLFVVHFIALVCGFQMVLVMKRIAAPCRDPWRTWAACLFAAFLLFLLYAGYPFFRSLRHDWNLSRQPSRVVIEYSARCGWGGEPPGFVVATNRLDVEHRMTKEGCQVVLVRPEKMEELLQLLREEGYFRMDRRLLLVPNIDALEVTLAVSNSQHEQRVTSWPGTPEHKKFARLLSRLRKELDM